MTTQSTKAIIKKERNMAMEHTHGRMDPNTLEHGMKTESMVKASIPGTTADSMKETGKITIWMDMVFTLGKMEGNMKASTKRIRNMAKVSTLVPTVGNTMESGRMVDNMERVNTYLRLDSIVKVCGPMVKEKSGSMKTKIEILKLNHKF